MIAAPGAGPDLRQVAAIGMGWALPHTGGLHSLEVNSQDT